MALEAFRRWSQPVSSIPKMLQERWPAFTGGFKREHGAFRYGDLAQKNHGSHYGFVENGVVFSKLQPGLATIIVLMTANSR